MSSPDDRFAQPAEFGEGSVWIDRVGVREFTGHTRGGVEIPIGHGEGMVSPGELLKLALLGCAGMSADLAIGRRVGEGYDLRLHAHGVSDPDTNRYAAVEEQLQLDVAELDEKQIATLRKVIAQAIAVGCTVERSVTPGLPVHHVLLDSAATPMSTAHATPTSTSGAAPAPTPDGEEQA